MLYDKIFMTKMQAKLCYLKWLFVFFFLKLIDEGAIFKKMFFIALKLI